MPDFECINKQDYEKCFWFKEEKLYYLGFIPSYNPINALSSKDNKDSFYY